MFRVKNISFAYPAQAPLFEGFTCDFLSAENTLIGGENGCGKSTLLRLLVGDLKCQSGEIIGDKDRRYFYVPQHAESRILGLSLEQDLRLWQIAGLRLSMSELEGLPLLQGFDPQLFRLPLRELSTGTKQAYILSLALLHTEHFLILDEALPSLDEQRKAIFCNELSKRHGILAVSHEDFTEHGIFAHRLTLAQGRLR
jgi:ABC-type Mn2+/Zn2+ transport system ATPase subunit